VEEVRYMISETAKRVGVEAHVLRYWQKQLELPISRNEMDQRYYKDSDIELFIRVKHLIKNGFQLKAIKMILSDIDKADIQDALLQEPIRQDISTADTIMTDSTVTEAPASGLKLSANNENGEEQMQYMEENKENTNETSLITERAKELPEDAGSKMDRFSTLLNHILVSALKENNEILSQEISGNVTECIIREMNYLMRVQEEKEEERYRKFDATLRDYQKSRMMAAAATDRHKKRKSKFFTKNRVYI
jgi:DNA-binding transcriptional MerR regulator